jgi:hypothetical protein
MSLSPTSSESTDEGIRDSSEDETPYDQNGRLIGELGRALFELADHVEKTQAPRNEEHKEQEPEKNGTEEVKSPPRSRLDIVEHI